jgi:preprotein translocase subunit SecA
MSFLNKIFGDANERYIQSLMPVVELINSLEEKYSKLSDEELSRLSQDFRSRLDKEETLDDILPDAFAAVREASKRTLGQRHFNVQLLGGIVLHQGKIAEMRTGEGKTLVATLPTYLNALAGNGAHVVTVNDYLARRDATWMGQIYNALGLSVGCINHETSFLYDPKHTAEGKSKIQITNSKEDGSDKLDKERDTLGAFKVVHEFMRPVSRREAYEADITYGTNNEFGFDYLRDNMAYEPIQMVQAKGHGFAIVDEVDSILIDEARTPLIISAPDSDSTKLYETFAKTVPRLKENEDYNVDEKLKAVSITEQGIEKVEKLLGLANIYAEGGVRYVHHLEQALKASVLFKLDRDYVVKDGEVIIVDEFTGRLMPGRRWSEGLHQAVEAKEGVSVQKESRTLATITFQNYFRLYSKLSGMTGTAQTSAEEFHKVYGTDVVAIPTNKPMARVNHADRIYKTENGKFKALAKEIKERHEKGQPILVGTVSIEKNELLSMLLEKAGVSHNILNAKNHEKEAEIIAQAGRLGAVTVATNMAGRGVDIILGGNPPESEEGARVRELGGLHVLGTERHEARRIDDQLRGRAGRQGDPGSSQFYVSTQDDLIRVFGGDRLKNMMDRLGVGEDDMIENKFISKAIEQAQSKIEGNNFDIRKYVLEYDDVMNKHRQAVYKLRKDILFSKSIKELSHDYIADVIEKLVVFHTGVSVRNYSQDTNLEEIAESIQSITGSDIKLHGKINDNYRGESTELSDFLVNYALEQYKKKEDQVGEDNMRRLEKILLLRTIDEIWIDHIEAMEYLRDSVRLRAYGQRDPLVEYKIESQKIFQNLLDSIRSQFTNLIFKVNFIDQPKQVRMEEKRPDIVGESHIESHIHQESKTNSAPQGVGPKEPGRNDSCPCGSGKKYKKCHGK